MERKYLLRSPFKIAKFSRLLAKGIDLFLVIILLSANYPIGTLLAIMYLTVCDSMNNGQSFGKRMIGFAVVSLEDGKPCSLKQSFIRNLPLTLPLSLFIIPFWGFILGTLLGIPLLILELYLMLQLDSGHRLGDVMADTTVIANDPTRELRKKKRNTWFESENLNTL